MSVRSERDIIRGVQIRAGAVYICVCICMQVTLLLHENDGKGSPG